MACKVGTRREVGWVSQIFGSKILGKFLCCSKYEYWVTNLNTQRSKNKSVLCLKLQFTCSKTLCSHLLVQRHRVHIYLFKGIVFTFTCSKASCSHLLVQREAFELVKNKLSSYSNFLQPLRKFPDPGARRRAIEPANFGETL